MVEFLAVRTRVNSSTADWTNVATGMIYEAFGSVKTMSLGNGERSVTTYGDDGRLDGRRLYKVADGSNISHLTYGYDADDNMTRITDRLDATRNQNFAYDPVGRLVRVTTASGDMRRTDYVFDDNGNRIRTLTRALPDGPASSAVTERYTLAAGTNRLASITAPSGNRSLTHDARGNLAVETRPGGVAVNTAYDGYGRLTGYTRTGEANLVHIYNGMDDRVATTAGSTARQFVYAPDGRVLGEYGNSATDVKAEYIWMNPEVGEASASLFGGDDGLGGYMPLAVAANDNGGTSQLIWVHANHMGVPIRYSDAAGTTVVQGGWQAPGFPGQSRTLPDLYYNRYRDYDSSTGRYIQADPIGLAGGPSPYSYAMNNPIRYTDSHGLITYWEHYTGLSDSYRTSIINAIAGVSDAATFGLTYEVRDLIGANRDVTVCSTYYRGGEWASLALGGARLVYAGGSKLAAHMAADGLAASAFRNNFKRVMRGPFATSNYRVKPYDELLKKYGSDEAVKAAAGRTNPYVNTVGSAAAGGGAVGLASDGCVCE